MMSQGKQNVYDWLLKLTPPGLDGVGANRAISWVLETTMKEGKYT